MRACTKLNATTLGYPRTTGISRSSILKSIAAAAVIAATNPSAMADGLVNPFDSSGISMSKDDTDLMREALRSVLNAKQAGAAADWKSPSGLAGRATVLDVFERNEMPCANVEHVFTAGGGSTYRLPFCATADGTWKIAF